MESLTIGQIGGIITLLVGLIGGIGYLSQSTKKWIKMALKDQMEGIEGKINTINSRLDKVDMESTKNYLVTFLSDVERGKYIDEIEKQRFYEQMAHYQSLGGNSYIKDKVEKMKSKDLL